MGVLRRHRRFAAFCAGQTLSAIGTWATLVALWGVAGYRFDVDASGMTAIALGWSVPPLLFGPVAGVVIDRVGPRPVLLWSQVGAVAALSGLVASTTFTHLVALGFAMGVARAFFEPAQLSLPARLVGPEDLPAASALLRLANQFALVIGPALGGAAIAWIGFDGAFIVDIVSYVAGIAAVVALPRHLVQGPATAAAPGGSRWHQAVEGVNLARRTPVLRRVLFVNSAVALLYGSYLVLEPLYVRLVLGRSAAVYAAAQSVFGLTLVLTSAYTVRAAARLTRPRVVAAAVVGSSLAAMAYLGTRSLAACMAGVAAWGVTTAFWGAPATTLLLQSSPPEAHGRVMALDRTIDSAVRLVATTMAGVMATAAGVRFTAMACAAPALAIGLASLRPLAPGPPGTQRLAGPARVGGGGP